MKTLVTLPSIVEAEVLVSKLKADGIDAEIPDRHTINMGPHLTPVLGGIRVAIPDEDWERASQILRETTPLTEGEMPPKGAVLTTRTRLTSLTLLTVELAGVAVLIYFIVMSFFGKDH